jgi:hypothetical protein
MMKATHRTTNRVVLVSLFTSLAVASADEGIAQAGSSPPLLPSVAAHYPPGTHYKPLCPTPDEHGRRCFGQILVDADDKPISDATSPPGGWTPIELEAAYGLPATGGTGTIIATYIGNHYTNAESDVAVYRSMYGMTPCTSANGCFTQITDSGGTDFTGLTDDGCNGFIGEESLDVDMLMAGCPNCKIIVMEGGDHAAAIATASKLGAVSMNMSWGYTASLSDCESVWVPPAGLALFGASGDQGYTASPGAPSACAAVVAVGWTQLATDSSARGYADTIPANWGSAGGCDPTIPKSSWQADPSCSSRMISDVSANGDNVAAYCTSPAGSANWRVTGGSSAASPFTSGVLATLGITGGSFDPAWLYANASKFWDVTTGGPVQNCPSGSATYFCSPIPGYDGPTGVGTPYGPMLTGIAVNDDAGSGGNCTTPGGSYSESCTSCSAAETASGCLLTCATCKEINGSENPNPSLLLPCTGSVVNNNGALQCIGGTSDDGDGGDDGGSGADGAAASKDGGSGADATVPPPPTFDAGSGSDSGYVPPSEDASTTSGLGDNPGAPGTNGSSGCGCTEAGSAHSLVSPLVSPLVALSGGLFLVWSRRRRRKS